MASVSAGMESDGAPPHSRGSGIGLACDERWVVAQIQSPGMTVTQVALFRLSLNNVLECAWTSGN